MGPFMVEIVFCRVTRRGRKLKKGMNKAGRENMRNDGPAMSFIPPDDTIKVTLVSLQEGPRIEGPTSGLLGHSSTSRGLERALGLSVF